MAAPPGTIFSAVPDGHRANGWMGIDDVANGGGRRIPRPAIPEERRLAVRALQGRAMKDDSLLAQSKCGEGRTVPGIEAPAIQQVGGSPIGIIVDPGGAHR